MKRLMVGLSGVVLLAQTLQGQVDLVLEKASTPHGRWDRVGSGEGVVQADGTIRLRLDVLAHPGEVAYV